MRSLAQLTRFYYPMLVKNRIKMTKIHEVEVKSSSLRLECINRLCTAHGQDHPARRFKIDHNEILI